MRALVLVWSLALPAVAFGKPLAAGAPAPPFALDSSTGKKVALADYKGKRTVVLAFFPKAFTGG